ncbi:MAG: hypothetical protein JXB07_01440 [Anaerolineae bacterium]|nr:hypothetical protein [Anaerolineae bacterium]
MQVKCKHCGQDIPAEDINLERLMAKCRSCNAVFSIEDQVDGEAASGFTRQEVPKPKGFKVEDEMGTLKIIRPWFGLVTIPLTFFCLFWNGFMAFWFGTAITQRIWIMAAFGILHAIIGLVMAYTTIASYLNRTVVKVRFEGVEVKNGPLPSFGNKRLETIAIKQLYTKEIISRGRSSYGYSYEVHAVTTDDRNEVVVGGLEDSAQALYIEQEIERALGIKDRPVRGELPR